MHSRTVRPILETLFCLLLRNPCSAFCRRMSSRQVRRKRLQVCLRKTQHRYFHGALSNLVSHDALSGLCQRGLLFLWRAKHSGFTVSQRRANQVFSRLVAGNTAQYGGALFLSGAHKAIYLVGPDLDNTPNTFAANVAVSAQLARARARGASKAASRVLPNEGAVGIYLVELRARFTKGTDRSRKRTGQRFRFRRS